MKGIGKILATIMTDKLSVANGNNRHATWGKMALLTTFSTFIAYNAYVQTSYQPAHSVKNEIAEGYSPANWSDNRANQLNEWLETKPNSCRWPHQETALKISLGQLDHTVATTNSYDEKSLAFQNSLEQTKNVIFCSPLRHNAWLDRLRLDAVVSFNIKRIEELAGITRASSPFQLGDLYNRIDAYETLPGLEHVIDKGPVKQDLINLIRYGQRKTILRALDNIASRGVELSFLSRHVPEQRAHWFKKSNIFGD
ncbi:MAG: hypothetical protein OIF56_15110 [Cohaesibacter sp.]|nr:hypothetical protein [Cohaesibacter sp.]